jgi:hypothetical protein
LLAHCTVTVGLGYDPRITLTNSAPSLSWSKTLNASPPFPTVAARVPKLTFVLGPWFARFTLRSA